MKSVNAYFVGGPDPPKRVRWYDGTIYEYDNLTSRKFCRVYRAVKEQPA